MSPTSGSLSLCPSLDECYATVTGFLRGQSPGFFGRIGGSDTDLVVQYAFQRQQSGPDAALAAVLPQVDIVKRYNGYYDRIDDPANVARYCECLLSCYEVTELQFLVGAKLLTKFLPDTLHPTFHEVDEQFGSQAEVMLQGIAAKRPDAAFYPYAFVERMTHGRSTLFRAFAETLAGQTVLVICPFGESIEGHFEKRHSFFRDLEYPDFRLVTYNTPITYSGLSPDFYPHDNWFGTLDAMKRDLSMLQFDVALLSCGSYAAPLGVFIRDTLGRKAVYVGGILQLFFGIMGRRYDNPFFLDQIRLENFILPAERQRYLRSVQIDEKTPAEAFGAYF